VTRCINHRLCFGTFKIAEFHDAVTVNSDIKSPPHRTCAVDDFPTPDD
jgi:hypothetical protein